MLHINSFNARGLADGTKRRTVFKWLQTFHSGIVFLQETHSHKSSEKEWLRDWGGSIYFSHGTTTARGVAILIPHSLDVIVNNIDTDKEGRYVSLNVIFGEAELCLINAYAPTKDKEDKQVDFLQFVRNQISDLGDKNILLGGDLNVYLNPELDKKGGTITQLSKYGTSIHELMEDFNLADVWRTIYPNSRQYTWRGNTRQGLVQSRLDYWLASVHMLYDLQMVSISPGVRSDHSIIKISFSFKNTPSRGRGFWKFNSSLLRDEVYIKRVKDVLSMCDDKYVDLKDHGLLWEVVKCEIRSDTLSYCSWKARTERERQARLHKRLAEIEPCLDTDNTLKLEFDSLKRELENLMEDKAKGAYVRARAKYIEQGEKCTKFFLQQEKSRAKTKCITSLFTDSGLVESPALIMKEQEKFYRNLYSKNVQQNCESPCSFFNHDFPTLNDEDKENCDKGLTLEEIGQSLKELPNNKAPGTDGFTADFYKFFWPDIKFMVFNSFMHAFESKTLSVEQRRAILTLLPKGDKDIRFLKNWRPLSLLNTDYKILTKTLALRLQRVIPKIVHPNQTGCVKGRYIGENIRILMDMIDFANCHTLNSCVAFLDFEKAFDSVSWQFLFKTLHKFNFGPDFISWIQIIYSKPECAVTNNGHASEFFTITRGIRQGCPISALLFILVAEVMSINIRNSKNIKGFVLGDVEIKITQYADDTSLFLSDIDSLRNVIKLLDNFSTCSGLKLNKEKTEAIQLGIMSHEKSKSNLGIKWIDQPTKVLGVWICRDPGLITEKNVLEKIQKIKSVLNMYKARNITIKGKITILKSLVIPLLLYIASVIIIPEHNLNEIKKMFFDFIWPSGKHHVKQNVLIQNIEEGGLQMPDVFSICKSVKITWLKRLYDHECLLNKVVSCISGIDIKMYISCKIPAELMKNIPKFYRQVFEYWNEIHNVEPSTANDIYNEVIWNNMFIQIEGKPVWYKNWHDKGIVKIAHLYDENGKLNSLDDLHQQFGIKKDHMMYNSVISAIPRQWKAKLKNVNFGKLNLYEETYVYLSKIPKLITKVKCRDIYWHLVGKKYVTPSSIIKWQQNYIDVHFEWELIYKCAFYVARETALQSFQYKVLNRYLPCQHMLFKWNKADNSICKFCDEYCDTIEHFLVECNISRSFWNQFFIWWKMIYEVEIVINTLDILFGFANQDNDVVLNNLNFCVLLGKYFIYRCKINENTICFNHFKYELHKRLQCEKCIMQDENKIAMFNHNWSQIMHVLE